MNSAGSLDPTPPPPEDATAKSKAFLGMFRYANRTDYLLIVISFIFNLGSGSIMPIFMSMFGGLIDSVGGAASAHSFLWYTKWQLILGGISFVTCTIGVATMEFVAERQMRSLKTIFFKSLIKQEVSWFESFDAGELSARLSECCSAIREGMGIKLAQTLFFAGLFIGGYVVGLIRGWKLALVVSSALPLIALSAWLLMSGLSNSTKNARLAYASAGSLADECLSAIRTIMAFGLEQKFIQDFVSKLEESYKFSVREGVRTSAALGSMMGVIFLSYALGFWYGSKLVANDMKKYGNFECLSRQVHCETGGNVMSVFFCVIIAAFAIGQAGPNFGVMNQACTAFEELAAIIHRPSTADPFDEDGVQLNAPLQGEIVFQDIEFSYPTRPDQKIFGRLNLRVPAGQSVALVGASGCGKSTITQLVERFHQPNGGEITVDGRNIRDYNLKWYRSQIALVSQEPRLFAASIRSNIANGKAGATEKEVEEAAKNANAHDFIMNFPKRYETFTGHGGSQLSGGQKQRVAIARAVIRDPSILILDEATSALDNESEKVIQATLDAIMARKKRTTIIIAHRLSTIRNADKIVVLDRPDANGAVVVEEGTDEELMNIPDGLYRKLVLAQQMTSASDVGEVAESFEKELPAQSRSFARLLSKFSRRSRGGSSIRDGPAKKKIGEEDYSGPRIGWRRVAKNLRRSWFAVLMGLVGALINGCVWPVFSIFFSKFIRAFYEPTWQGVEREGRKWSVAFVIFGIVTFVANLLQNSNFTIASQVLVRHIREELFTSLVYQDMEFHDDPKNSAGVISELMAADVLALKGWASTNVGIYAQNVTSLIAAIIIAFTASWKVALVSLGSTVIMVPSVALESMVLGLSGKEEKTDAGTVSSSTVLSETITNIRIVAAFSMESALAEQYSQMMVDNYNSKRLRCWINGAAWGLSQFAQFAMQALCMWYGGNLVENGEIDVEKMMTAITAFMMAAMGIGQTMVFTVDAKTAQRAANKIYQVLDRVPKISARYASGDELHDVTEGIIFDKVNFAYPQRRDVQVYKDLCFNMRQGEVVALVGPSGCGKSTAVQLIERFYDVDDSEKITVASLEGGSQDEKGATALRRSGGRILINGTDIRDYDLRSLRGQIGLVSQEPSLFSCTISENVALGLGGEAQPQQIELACQQANAMSFISTLPDGLETNVGKHGGQMSGGQKQRIAISRALIRNPSILILDEATSALDTESERIVQAALDELLKDKQRLTLVIAHRLSTIRNADKIVVLANKDGIGSEVKEIGNHDSLMQIPNGIYRGLVEISERSR